MDLATIGLKAESSSIVKGANDLDKLTEAAKKTDAANDKLGTSTTKAGGAARDASGKFVKAGDAVKKAGDNAAKASPLTDRLTSSWGKASSILGKIGPLAAAAGIAVSGGLAVQSIIQFADAMAEVTTLVDTATFDLGKLEAAAIANSKEFGSLPAEQAKAFYQAISAGASTAEAAIDIMNTANKLAIGGVTDITTAVDGLTSVVNAYGDKIPNATAASDSLFVAMKAGKTTIGELSSSLGKVAPLAAQVGVEFDELTASVAALTKGGISTNIAVTGVRAILASVAKPTSEAAKLAAELGLSFNTAAIEADGFKGFLDKVFAVTNGNTDQLAQLFGGVEALVPILALAGSAGQDFATILEDMKNKGGATEEAFNKIANSPGFQIKRIVSGIIAEFTTLGSYLLPVLVPALKFVADNMWLIFEVIQVLIPLIAIVFGPTVLAMVGSLAVSIVSLLVPAFWALAAAAAANPIGAIVLAVTALIIIGYKLSGWLYQVAQELGLVGDLWDQFAQLASSALELVINVANGFWERFSSLFYSIRDLIANVANAIGPVLIEAISLMWSIAQPILEGLIFLLQKAVDLLNFVLTGVSSGAIGSKLAGAVDVSAAKIEKAHIDGGQKAAGAIQTGMEKAGADAATKLDAGVASGGDKAAAAIGGAVAMSADRAAATWERLNGTVIKPLGDTLVDGGKYIHNQVTGAITKSTDMGSQTMQYGITSAGATAGEKMGSAIRSSGAAVAQGIEIAGVKIAGELLNFMMMNPWKLERTVYGAIKADNNLKGAQAAEALGSAREAEAKAAQLRRGPGSGSGSLGSGGGSSGATTSSGGGGPRYDESIAEYMARIAGRGIATGSNFAAGGSVIVPGNGGIDSTPVQIMATPGERISVQTPGQQQASGDGDKVELKITNVIDPNMALDAFESQKGQRSFVNNIRANRDEVRAVLGVY